MLSLLPISPKRSNQSILKEINPEYSLEGLMLKLKLQYFATWCEEATHWKSLWCWERLMAGGEMDDRGWDGWITSPTQGKWVWTHPRRWWRSGKPDMLQYLGHKESGMPERLNNRNFTTTLSLLPASLPNKHMCKYSHSEQMPTYTMSGVWVNERQ